MVRENHWRQQQQTQMLIKTYTFDVHLIILLFQIQ